MSRAKKQNTLTLEQMREIVTMADSIKDIRSELTQLEEKLANGDVDWPMLSEFVTEVNQAFAKLRSPRKRTTPSGPAPEEPPAQPPPPSPASPPPPAPQQSQAKRGLKPPMVYTVEGREKHPGRKFDGATGTLGELCKHYNKDYGKVYQRFIIIKHWTLEEALELMPRAPRPRTRPAFFQHRSAAS